MNNLPPIESYDAQKDGHDSYYAAIEAKRQAGWTAVKKDVTIGDCRLLLGDCLEILPLLGKVYAKKLPWNEAQAAYRFRHGVVLVVLSVLSALALIAACTAAGAHDALPTAAKPLGWKYPFSCCSDYDCREIADAKIDERPEGYVIKATGEVIAYSDARIKESPDGRFHWCSVAGADDSRTICLFVPPRSF